VPAGTFYFQNFANVLDQFLVGKNMIGTAARLRAEPETVAIVSAGGDDRHRHLPCTGPVRRHGKGR
jgi:hypothetical protein